MLILGLNLFHADSSAALIEDGKVVFAIAEERLNRVKHYAGFPKLAIGACLDAIGARFSDVDHVAIGRDSDANLARKIQYVATNPRKILNFLQIRQRREALDNLRGLMVRELQLEASTFKFQEHHIEHHLAHIASAYYCSGWDSAAGFSYDGSGDFVTAMFARCVGEQIEVLERVFVPHSLGSFYTMLCEFLGYRKYGDEGKVMGLAPYGRPTYCDAIRKIVPLRNGTFQLDLDYFMPLGSTQGMTIKEDGTVQLARHYSPKMIELFGPPREPHSEITLRDMDVAYAMQQRFEEVFLHLLKELHRRAPSDRLAMAGGCALNSVANGKIFTETSFRQSWIQPAAGDEGLAIGAALYVYHSILKHTRQQILENASLGPEFSPTSVKADLDWADLRYQELERQALLETVAARIAAGDIVGWFQGRMEWGPRALGNRSILAHPGLADMKDVLNARIKHREWFRPFAPSILADRQDEYFEQSHPSPFMLHVYKIRADKRQQLCAVNHVDDTGRLQTVAKEENPLYYDLIKEFEKKTGIPVVLNTSFNENEPIVCTPAEAIDCFRRTRMDALAIGPYLVLKADNPC